MNGCCGDWVVWIEESGSKWMCVRKRSTKSILLLMHCNTSNTSRILNTFYAMFTHPFVASIYMLYTIHAFISRKRMIYTIQYTLRYCRSEFSIGMDILKIHNHTWKVSVLSEWMDSGYNLDGYCNSSGTIDKCRKTWIYILKLRTIVMHEMQISQKKIMMSFVLFNFPHTFRVNAKCYTIGLNT